MKKGATLFPHWLHLVWIAALLLGAACLVIVAIDVARHPQKNGNDERGLAGDRIVRYGRHAVGLLPMGPRVER